MKLSATEIAVLREAPFQGPELGSNFWPLLCVEGADGVELDGEVIDSLARRGFLAVTVASKMRTTPGDALRDIPDIDCRCDYDLAPAGRIALAEIAP